MQDKVWYTSDRLGTCKNKNNTGYYFEENMFGIKLSDGQFRQLVLNNFQDKKANYQVKHLLSSASGVTTAVAGSGLA